MILFRPGPEQAREKIAALDMSAYVKKAEELFGLNADEVRKAEREYRHFLYLVFWNRRKKLPISVVPTKRGDAIWHAHLLFNSEYNAFCQDVYGAIIFHKPGLEEGTEPFENAVIHTKLLHDRVGAEGFDKHYFDHVKNWVGYKDAKKQNGGSAGGCGSACGSGCGGGGCGGCGS